MGKNRRSFYMEADGDSEGNRKHREIKKQKLRMERRLAKQNPEVVPLYGRYRGYET